MMKRIVLVLTLGIVMATMLALAGASFAKPGNTGPNVEEELAKVRQATAKYKKVSNALADGYVATEHCVESPTGEGGMGYHYANPSLIGNPAVEPTEPEVLLYAPKNNGKLKLVAVEYFVVDKDQKLDTDSDRPKLFGVKPFNGPMLGHEPGMPIHYDLHAWIWKRNPSGVFADYNPRVSCPESPTS